MKSVFSRILLFLLAVPGIFALIVFLPWKHNLAFIVLCSVMSGLGTMELSGILGEKGYKVPVWYALALGLLLLAAEFIASYIGYSGTGFYGLVFSLALIVILSGAIIPRGKDAFEPALRDIGFGLLILAYPGVFMAYLIRLCFLPEARFFIIFLLLMVFLSDGLAYATGTLFGKKGSGKLKVSPSKTLTGFITIPVVSMGIAGTGGIFVIDPIVLSRTDAPELSRVFLYLLIGFTVSCASILGDLAESGFKRSAGRKDSGTIIPGRGGVLDSIDSLMFAAPIFYYLIRLML